MNKDQIEGDWKQIKGEAKLRWGKLTDDDMTVIAGKREKLLGKIQERYGYAKAQAEKELGEFTDSLRHAIGADAKTEPSKRVFKGSTAKTR